MNILRGGGLRKLFATRKGGFEKMEEGGGLRKFVYFKTNRRGAPKNWTAAIGGC